MVLLRVFAASPHASDAGGEEAREPTPPPPEENDEPFTEELMVLLLKHVLAQNPAVEEKGSAVGKEIVAWR